MNVVNSQPLRAVVWCAVSTKAQAEEDKTSLLTQEREAREFCASNGWTIADVLVVPGHSRYIVDFYELAEKASDGGCDAFWRLRDHWKAKDFDILIARDADRFAREQAPIALIISSIIQAGARIYTFTDGWIDKTDYRFKGTMIGYRAASEVDNLMKKAAAAKDQLAKTGIYYNARPAWSHKVVRDELGKALGIVPDEEKQFIIENAARIVVEGIGWFHIEEELNSRYGILNISPGKTKVRKGQHRIQKHEPVPFVAGFFYQLFHTPMFWGHTARRWRTDQSQKTDMWVFDEGVPCPEGVLIRYNTHAPALSGELAESLKAELRRRRRAIRGRTRPHRTKRFAGLLVCGSCGYNMTFFDNGTGYNYYRCPSVYVKGVREKCASVQYIPERHIQAYFDTLLRRLIETKDLSILQGSEADTMEAESRSVQSRIADVEARSRRLIEKQASADSVLTTLYDDQLRTFAHELKELRARVSDLERKIAAPSRAEQKRALDDIEKIIDGFWEQEGVAINQLLHRLMGTNRLAVKDKAITDLVRFV